MAAHLYGDLPETKNKEQEDRHGITDDTATTPWSDVAKPPPPPTEIPTTSTDTTADIKEMSQTETTARPALLAPPRSVLKKQSSTPSAIVTDVHAGHRETDSGKFGYRLFGDIEDEYDPAKPNDYEAVIQERERKKREAEMEAEKQERLMQQQIEEKEQRERERKEKRQSPSHPEDEEEGRHPRRKITSSETSVTDSTAQTPQTGEGKGMSLAQKMLEKYGWREGEGLGKQRQGMATPLIAQKTDKRSAVIVKAQQLPKTDPVEVTAPPSQVPPVKGKPTRVVLLRNLVGPGKVDDDLEDEVANELQKYGHVQSVLIFEVTEDNFPAEEAVRTFIEFKTTDESRKAATALNGRFFGKRIVRAGYYDEAKFYGCDLAPVAGEFA